MIAIKGIYQGGDTVKLDMQDIPVNEPYEVEVAFLNPLLRNENPAQPVQEKSARRLEAFQRFMQYKGTLPADFDYKKELAEYLDERHGNIN